LSLNNQAIVKRISASPPGTVATAPTAETKTSPSAAASGTASANKAVPKKAVKAKSAETLGTTTPPSEVKPVTPIKSPSALKPVVVASPERKEGNDEKPGKRTPESAKPAGDKPKRTPLSSTSSPPPAVPLADGVDKTKKDPAVTTPPSSSALSPSTVQRKLGVESAVDVNKPEERASKPTPGSVKAAAVDEAKPTTVADVNKPAAVAELRSEHAGSAEKKKATVKKAVVKPSASDPPRNNESSLAFSPIRPQTHLSDGSVPKTGEVDHAALMTRPAIPKAKRRLPTGVSGEEPVL